MSDSATLSPELRCEYDAHPAAEPFLMVDGAVVNATTWRALQAELAAWREQVKGHCDRIAAQSELLARQANKGAPLKLRSDCHPQARGRRPLDGEIGWTLRLMLESGQPLQLQVGQKSRDILFGMMIADCHDSGEAEPEHEDFPP